MKSPHPILAAMLFSAGMVMPMHALSGQENLQEVSPLIPVLQASMRAGVHDDYERIVIEWPTQIPFSLQQNGQDVQVHFDAAGALDVSVIARRHLTRVLHAQTISDGKGSNLNLIVAPDVVAKAVPQDGLVIIDLYRGKAPVLAQIPQASTTVPQALLIAGETPAAALSNAHEPAPEKPAEKTTEPAAEPAVEIPKLTQAEPLLKHAQDGKSAPDLADIGDVAMPLVTFDTGVPIGAAIYRRADYVYVVFSKKITLPLSGIVRDTPRVNIESLQSQTGTVYRFYMPQNLDLRAVREESKWTILASQKAPSVPLSLTFTAQPDYALGPRILIPVNNADEPVRFADPELGDGLVVVPVLTSGQAIRTAHRFADFRMLACEQGIVLQPLVEDVTFKRQSVGIEITSDKGLRLSPSKDTGFVAQASVTEIGKDQIFNLSEWYGPAKKPYTEMRQYWQQTLSEVAPVDRDRTRLNTARFYFARNHAQEALGILNILAQQVPDLVQRAEFIALRGAVRVLCHDPQALDDLNNPELANYAEIKLWRAVAKTQSLEWKEASELFALGDGVLAKYPEPFFTDFSILAVEAALANKSKPFAAKILDRLIQRRPDLDKSSAPVSYLRGVLLSVTDQLDRAAQYWTKAAKGKDRLYKVRAELSLVDYGVITQKIAPLQAAEKLEHLRFAWRGDDLELDILRRLGKFYIEAGKMEDGLATLKQAMMLLPDNDAAKLLHDEMTFAFRDVFLGDKSKTIPPLQALSLYERFYDLAPEGPEGDAIIRNLAQHMVSLDLLDRAGALLGDQARRRLSGALKTKVGTQAAGIFLLDRKAQEAIGVLYDTDSSVIDSDLILERNLLKAKALSLQGKDDEAMSVLKNLNDENATRLLVDIAWHAHDWAVAAEKLDSLIGAPSADPIKSETAQLIINRAIALALINDKTGLSSLRTNFGAAMKMMPQAELFKTLVEPENGLPPEPSAMKPFMADVDLFQPYLENYRNLK